MDNTFQAPATQLEAPADEQAIIIRKLDRVETTSPCSSGN
jgi:hypothetical protein